MIYDCLVGVGVLFYLRRILSKKRPTLRERFGFDLPAAENVIWVHAVSVGEVKSTKGLIAKLRAEYPDAFILFTMGTATGFEEATRSLKGVDAFRFMPLDFSWIMRKWIRRLQPKLLIFVEGDIWYNLLKYAKKFGAKTALVSGRVSERSAGRYQKLGAISRYLFSLFDTILVQNQEQLGRFLPWAPQAQIGGNLKFDATPVPVDLVHGNRFSGFNILISCTHAPEEADMLEALKETPGTIYLAPRHPERFDEVAALLESKNISYSRWSQAEVKPVRVVLVDSMGQLPIFYTFCDLAIVAGSYSSQIGGHNVLEPCLYGQPVFFGPSMHQQTELAQLLLKSGAGAQVAIESLAEAIRTHNLLSMRKAARAVSSSVGGALATTFSFLEKKAWE